MSQILPKKRNLSSNYANRAPVNGERRISGHSHTHNHSNRDRDRALSVRGNYNNNNTHGNSNNNNNSIATSSSTIIRSLNADDSFDDNAIHFNENKHTILTNFEEWIKLSTDNKITSKNSWQFALIDYFHDLNVIKDGDNINFQRASATLDGCVKIYSSRVESAATETGKLLSGLAKKKEADMIEENEEENAEKNGEDDKSDDEDSDEDGKKKRKINRIVESTLVDFETLRIKKLEQELAIDPLFKKALAEFDEGGAKSLLLNTLNIDGSGRVVFDATTKPANQKDDETEEIDDDDEENPFREGGKKSKNDGVETDNKEVDISKLSRFLFRNDEDFLETATICPSLSEFHSAIEDITKAKSILNDFNSKIATAADVPIEINSVEPEIDDDNNGDFGYGFADNDDYNDFNAENENLDDDDNNNSHNSTNVNNSNDPLHNLNQSIMQRLFDDEEYVQSATSIQVLDRDLMAYFDERMKVNWRGPEHWKVAALKRSKNIGDGEGNDQESGTPGPLEAKKKQKQAQVIVDFFTDEDNEDLIFEGPKNASAINKKHDSSGGTSANIKNRLPDDIRYNSARLTNLFTKPQVSILYFPKMKKSDAKQDPPQFTDEKFFAEQYQKQEDDASRFATSFHQAEYDDFNADFGGDDDFGAIDFNDALAGEPGELNTDDKDAVISGSQVMGRRRPDYVNFSRVAKRVDVKLLKDNLWSSIKKEQETNTDIESGQNNESEKKPVKTFGNLVASVSNMYGAEQRKDLSTSFCFICILHLANEHGLSISANENHDDLEIVGF
ncbi:condensin complex subunit 2/barren [Scheffersomyces xylosifermentans]|uniref:condensin complex subunit 2/barren n=1 Tax=Scheffersomyces xylosifermentans TaxID=1304137 RepID=UPI00315D16F3